MSCQGSWLNLLETCQDCSMALAFICWPVTAETHFSIWPAYVEFVVDKVRTDNPFMQAEFGTAFY
jgi:hypothetical protein